MVYYKINATKKLIDKYFFILNTHNILDSKTSEKFLVVYQWFLFYYIYYFKM